MLNIAVGVIQPLMLDGLVRAVNAARDMTIVAKATSLVRFAVSDLPNGLIRCASYDEAGRLKTLQTFPSSAGSCSSPATLVNSRQKYDLSYAMSGPTDTEQLQSLTDEKTADVTAYSYDVLNRLKEASTTGGSNSSDFAYTYDGAGNRMRVTTTIGSGSPTSRFTAYNAANELCKLAATASPACGGSPGAGIPSYDANGNQLTDGAGRTLAFNFRDQITSITPSGGSATATVHRGTNQQDLAGVGGSEVVTSALGAGATGAGSAYFTRDSSGGLLARRSSSGTPSATKYYLQDPLGSVAMLTNSVGAQTDPSAGTYRYDPYGGTLSPTVPSDFGWRSAYLAPGGLIHFGYRYYDPSTGIWTQQDPLNQPDDLTQADRYPYAGDDPIGGTDPSGLCVILSCKTYGRFGNAALGTIGIAGAVGTATTLGPVAAAACGADELESFAHCPIAVGAVYGLAATSAVFGVDRFRHAIRG